MKTQYGGVLKWGTSQNAWLIVENPFKHIPKRMVDRGESHIKNGSFWGTLIILGNHRTWGDLWTSRRTPPRSSQKIRSSWLVLLVSDLIWLVVYLPLWKIWKSVGMIIPNRWTNKKCSKPPTSHDVHPLRNWLNLQMIHGARIDSMQPITNDPSAGWRLPQQSWQHDVVFCEKTHSLLVGISFIKRSA